MENLSIMNILSMLSGLKKSPDKSAEPAAPAENGNSPFGLGNILSSLSKNNAPAESGEKAPPSPPKTTAAKRVKIDVNPLISAMKSHEEFIKRVNGKNKP